LDPDFGMATVGEQLKAARESQRLSVHRVAEVTRMRTDQVLAIEAGNHTGFVAPVYLRGFVRAYARFVHVDEAAVLSQLDQETGRVVKPKEPVRVAADRESAGVSWEGTRRVLGRLRWQRLGPILAGVLIALLGFLLLRPSGSGDRNADGEPAPALYKPAGPGSADLLPLPEGPDSQE
jgi:cytoskeletal protein RodZ